LQLNADKSTAALFTPDPNEYNTTLNLTITLILPLQTHHKLHASQLKEKTKLSLHPLHPLRTQPEPPRITKTTIFQQNNDYTTDIITNPQNIDLAAITNNMKLILYIQK